MVGCPGESTSVTANTGDDAGLDGGLTDTAGSTVTDASDAAMGQKTDAGPGGDATGIVDATEGMDGTDDVDEPTCDACDDCKECPECAKCGVCTESETSGACGTCPPLHELPNDC